jgi:hypothetical protein
MTAVRAPRFVWNAGAWFGTQVGCTAWLFVFGAALLRDDGGFAALAFGGGALLTGLGVLLWSRRAKLSPFAAYQLLFAALAVVLTVLTVLANTRGLQTPVPPGSLSAYWAIAIPPAMMGLFAVVHRRG